MEECFDISISISPNILLHHTFYNVILIVNGCYITGTVFRMVFNYPRFDWQYYIELQTVICVYYQKAHLLEYLGKEKYQLYQDMHNMFPEFTVKDPILRSYIIYSLYVFFTL